MLDSLESRRLLAATLEPGGVLTVTGTGKNDVISIFLDGGNALKIDVKVNRPNMDIWSRKAYSIRPPPEPKATK